MKMPNFLNFLKKDQPKDQLAESGQDPNLQTEEPIDEESISNGTKIKVIAAFLIVGFAAYIAWWVQEPSEIKADVLSSTEQSTQTDASPTDMSASTETALSTEAPFTELVAENTTEQQSQMTSTEEQTQMESQELQMTQEVSILNFAFNPAELNLPVGGTVIWTNKDSVPHTVTGLHFGSGTLDPGQSFTYTFEQDGTYNYACSLHPSETGVIIVGTGASESLTQETEQLTQENPIPAAVEENMTQEPPLTPPANILGTEPQNSESLTNLGMGGDENQLHQAAAEQLKSNLKGGKLAKSGPEDFLYLGIFLVILYLKRKSLFQAR